MTDSVPHDGVPELLGAYALDAVDPAERELVEAHLAGCPRCRAEVEEHREVAALLANVGRPAPEGLWDRIAEALEGPPPPLNLVPSGDRTARAGRAGDRRRRPRFGRALAVSALAAAAAVIIALGVRVDQLQGNLDEIDTAIQARLTEDRLPPEVPGGLVVDMTASDGTVQGVQAVITSEGEGYLAMGNLPELPAGRTYQLWGDTGDGLISLGVLGRDPQPVETFDAGSDFVAFALTAEQAPGVVESTQPAVAAGQVRA